MCVPKRPWSPCPTDVGAHTHTCTRTRTQVTPHGIYVHVADPGVRRVPGVTECAVCLSDVVQTSVFVQLPVCRSLRCRANTTSRVAGASLWADVPCNETTGEGVRRVGKRRAGCVARGSYPAVRLVPVVRVLVEEDVGGRPVVVRDDPRRGVERGRDPPPFTDGGG